MDCSAKGRANGAARAHHGMDHGRHKLTDDDVRMIRESTETLRALAQKLGVTMATIGFVRRRVTWRHIT
jgi:DNA transposition AAA+ family ATPase